MLWVVLGMLAFVVIVLLAIAAYAISVYNDLVRKRNNYENQFSQIDVQLKRRYDLIPNLVEVAKGYMSHEKETLEAVIQARNHSFSASQAAAKDPSDPNSMKQLMQAEGQLNNTLSRLMVVSEQYPDLKANTNMQDLQKELRDTEDKVAFTRQAFNNAVTSYNTYKQTFPPVLFAATFGHAQDASLLDFDDDEIQEPPDVSFT